MIEILNDVKMMFLTDSVIAVIVFLAMMVDLGAGLYKAHLRGDARRSEALKRTGYKFLIYEGGILIASCVDLLIHMGKLYHIMGWNIAMGLALGFSYILFEQFSKMFVVTDTLSAGIATWIPNILYAIIAAILYIIAPK